MTASTTLSATVDVGLSWNWTTGLDLSTPASVSSLTDSTTFTYGTGWGQVDDNYHDSRALASAASESLDLTSLSYTVFGQTIGVNFASVKVILIINTATTSGEDLIIDQTVANGFITPWNAATKVSVPANSFYYQTSLAGFTVTAGTGDLLKITNDGTGEITYKIYLGGVSA